MSERRKNGELAAAGFPECGGLDPATGRTQPCARCAQPAAALIESYRRIGSINHLEGKNLPSKRAVGLIARDLLRLLFPGFLDERLPHADELEGQVASLLHSVCQRLREEITKSLRCSPACPALPEVPSLAGVITAEFLRALERCGTIERGKRADLVLLRSARLLDLVRVGVPAIRAVVKGGRVVARAGRRSDS